MNLATQAAEWSNLTLQVQQQQAATANLQSQLCEAQTLLAQHTSGVQLLNIKLQDKEAQYKKLNKHYKVQVRVCSCQACACTELHVVV